MKKVSYPSPSIRCDGCADSIKGTLNQLAGVDTVKVDVPGKRVTVHYDESRITDEQIVQHMAQIGYPSPGPQPVTENVG